MAVSVRICMVRCYFLVNRNLFQVVYIHVLAESYGRKNVNFGARGGGYAISGSPALLADGISLEIIVRQWVVIICNCRGWIPCLRLLLWVLG